MGPRTKAPPLSRPTVERIAERIDDPLKRLRFLQFTAPLLVVPAPGRSVFRFLARISLFRLVLLIVAAAVALVSALLVAKSTHAAPLPTATLPVRPAPDAPAPDIWLVEKSASSETYSNGLRIDNHYVVSHYPRTYLAYPTDRVNPPVRRREPVGIVFHTTESHLVSFEAGQNAELRKIGESLLEYVQRKYAYHFLIDRFGRVFRVVAEGDAADHAGFSLWVDSNWLYINLNASFFGISLEGRTDPGQTESTASPAQVRSAAMLTEMLRNRYHIPAANCVTHAQVSVNPSNMEVGYHTDWASGFPFEQLGLPNNYAEAMPAVWAFGFAATPAFRAVAGVRMAEGIDLAEDALREASQTGRSTVPKYRKRLQEWYRQRLDAAN
jgi:N-acetylmuramoyl-L-alanine amidase